MSLIELQRSQFLEAIESVRPNNRYKVVVVDERSLKLLGKILKLSEILEFDVIRIDSIEKRRKPEPEIEAVYILTPSDRSISMLIKDFTITGQHNIPNGTMYRAANLFFTSELPDIMFKRVTTSPVKKYIAALKELCVEFDPIESRFFLTKLADFEMFRIYSEKFSSKSKKELQIVAKKLVNVCRLWGGKPNIFYMKHYAESLNSPIESIVSIVQSEIIKSFGDENSTPKTEGDNPQTNLLILDRSVDLFTPVLHEFTYEAMAVDLAYDSLKFTKNGKKYTYQSKLANGEIEEKTVEIDENDQVWLSFRYEHISDAQERIMKEIDQLAESNKAIIEMQSGKQQNLSKLRDVVSSMPKFKAKMAEYSVHVALMQQCMKAFTEKDLANIALIEQNMVMNLTPSKLPYSTGTFDVANLLSDPSVDPLIKKRVLLIYLSFNPKLTNNERIQLVDKSGLDRSAHDVISGFQELFSFETAVQNISKARSSSVNRVKEAKSRQLNNKLFAGHKPSPFKNTGKLGFKGSSPLLGFISGDRSVPGSPLAGTPSEIEPEKEPYDVSRYEPVVKSVVESFVLGNLDTKLFVSILSSKEEELKNNKAKFSISSKRDSSPTYGMSPAMSPGLSRSLRSTKATWQKSKSNSASSAGTPARLNQSSATNLHAMSATTDKSGSQYENNMSKSASAVRLGPKFIIYVIGGITFSEIRAINEVASKYNSDVIIGSTHTILPNSFIDDLSSLVRPGHRNDANGLQNPRNGPSPSMEPSSNILGFMTDEGIDPLVKFAENLPKPNTNAGNNTTSELSLEDQFMKKLKTGEDNWNDIKSKSASHGISQDKQVHLDKSPVRNIQKAQPRADSPKKPDSSKLKFFRF
ncbi:hypothetical protein BB560_002446 [Smittium megazygosporum]|uniref:Uncharacterized protein n=1 Tax=Smittium megazygosporum TaxID=133381 RepID=A0A2T9ZES3_9FUNG|nr:hypothetical protein BB560_002446 [Smittium megazygosporum]